MITRREFGFKNFAWRWLAALVLVYASYNPSGYSYLRWLSSDLENMLAPRILVGLVLLIGWVMFIRATWNSLGGLGLVLAATFFATLIWMFVDWGVLPMASSAAVVYAVEFVMAAVMAVGMSWSHVRRRIAGQYDTDEIEG